MTENDLTPWQIERDRTTPEDAARIAAYFVPATGGDKKTEAGPNLTTPHT